jgi:hypothetical protein
VDKDKLIKHHFWILLGLALVLVPVVLSGVWMGVAEATSKQAQVVESKKKSLTSQQPKGGDYIEEQEKQRKALDGSKSEVWKVNAEPQSDLIKWPRALASLDKLYFGEPLPKEDDYTNFKRSDVYLNEFEEMVQLVKPTELAGGWEKIMKTVRFGQKVPSNEDCWLALEDLCIQREMLECVKAVNKLLATFWNETAQAEKELNEYFKPMDGESVHRFVSPYWYLDLAVSRAAQGKGNEFNVRGRLTNNSHRRLNIGRIDFLVSMSEGRPTPLSVEGQFLGVGQSIEFKDKRIQGNVAKPTVVAVEQKLDSRFVPVKRIERIALGYHSHRTADKPLVMGAVSEEEKKKGPAAAPPPEADANAPPPVAGAAPPEFSNSGIPRLRYLTVTKQVRRMPIGIVMIVDQAHVQDVLRAFANSRLHFQTTQLHLTRYRQSGSGAFVTPAPAANTGGGLPVFPGGGSAAASGGEDTNTNLVEVALYGLASIYERYPPKGAQVAEGGGPPANPPTPPAAPTAAPTPAPSPSKGS